MKIGVIGSCGIVGTATKFGFQKLGHEVICHDLQLNTKINIVKECKIIYVCVPTPHNEDGSCDTSIVEGVVGELVEAGYRRTIVIKSTVTPGTTQKLRDKYQESASHPRFKICFVPEFLRERCAISDFVENHKLLAIGCEQDYIFETIKECHGHYPEQVIRMTPTEAELLKYYHNTFNALRVVFANEFYEVCSKFDVEYNSIKKGLLITSGVPDIYLDVNNNIRGYSSICWNKDVPALIQLGKELGIKLPLIDMIPEANNNFKKTPFEGTRESYD